MLALSKTNKVTRSTQLFGGVLLVLLGLTAHAHHGWAWAEDEKSTLTGEVTEISLGNPHGEVMLNADGQKWLVEVGQPWRNERAGLTRELLAESEEITIHGNRSSESGENRMKAVRVTIAGEDYVLYPDR